MRQIVANDDEVYDVMTIYEAIEIAKTNYQWVLSHSNEPTSVDVGFITVDGEVDETQFDLWGNDNEKNLYELWMSMYKEFNSTPDGILYVESYGYIVD